MNDQPSITKLAQKYTHPTGEQHTIIANTGKSGLTPLPSPTGIFLTTPEKHARHHFETYQRTRCLGFTVAELIALEAFAPLYEGYANENRPPFVRAQKLSDVHFSVQREYDEERVEMEATMPLHPLYGRVNWTKDLMSNRKRFFVGEGMGEWGAHNDEVWEVLKPCIRLASQFLNHAHKFAWWEAFLTPSQRKEVQADNIPEDVRESYNNAYVKTKLWNTIPLSPEQHRSPALIAEVQRNLASLVGKIEFEITSCKIEPLTGIAQPYGRSYGETGMYEINSKPVVFIPLEMLVPLLRRDMNAAERNLDIFRVAQTLLHETCHAMGYVHDLSKSVDWFQPEPYFNDQPMCESGFSMETSVWGGFSRFLIDEFAPDFRFGTELSCAAIFRGNWFNKSHEQYVDDVPVLLQKPDDWEYQDVYPIHVEYFEDIHHKEFWMNFATYGEDAMTMGPLVWGLRSKLPDGQLGILEWHPYDLDDIEEAFAPGPEPERLPDGPHIDAEGRYITWPMIEMEKRNRERQRRIYKQMLLVRGVNQNPEFESPGSPSPAPRVANQAVHDNPPQSASQPSPTHYSDVSMTETSAAYETIRSFLLANRSQGLLCLDSLPRFETFAIEGQPYYCRSYSANILHHHILQSGGLALTTSEWRIFLMQAHDRNELFNYDPEGRGQIFWIEPPDHQVPWRANPLGTATIHPTTYWFEAVQALCEYDYWIEEYAVDWDLHFLQWKLNQMRYTYDEGKCPPTFLDEKGGHLVAFIDYWDRQGRYWCWGPNRTARRLLGGWKEKPLHHDKGGDIFVFPERKPRMYPLKQPKTMRALSVEPEKEVPKKDYQIWWDKHHGEGARVKPPPVKNFVGYVPGRVSGLPGGMKKLNVKRPWGQAFGEGVGKRRCALRKCGKRDGGEP